MIDRYGLLLALKLLSRIGLIFALLEALVLYKLLPLDYLSFGFLHA